MLTFEEISTTQTEDKEYIAIGDNDKEYDAHWTTKYNGVMFFCIPSTVQVLGYKEK
jgi:hypothetical protein